MLQSACRWMIGTANLVVESGSQLGREKEINDLSYNNDFLLLVYGNQIITHLKFRSLGSNLYLPVADICVCVRIETNFKEQQK